MKIVINRCYGGFGLSKEAFNKYKSLVDEAPDYDGNIKRDCPVLIELVEQMGTNANDRFSELKVVEIPDGTDWIIEEYDGLEWISERHRTWG